VQYILDYHWTRNKHFFLSIKSNDKSVFLDKYVRAYHSASPGQLPTSGRPAKRKQALANQHSPWQCQCPLGWAPLATADKDTNHIVLFSLLELLLLRDSSSAAHTATTSLLAATPSADSKIGRLGSLGSPPPVLAAL
jgi:hypothetical protein